MEKRHEEYIKYYEVRFKKYENNPLYKNSYQAEKKMYEAIKNAKDLKEFGEILKKEKLNLKCAIALVKDQETARLNHYKSINEHVRAKAPEMILQIIDDVQDINELTAKVSEIDTKISREISIDLFTDQFYYDLLNLENIEIYEKARLPEGEWKEESKKFLEREINHFKKSWNENILPENRKWQNDWDLNYDNIWEDRHRRKIPTPDEVVKTRIEEHKKYRGI